jgi:hypothetical protein
MHTLQELQSQITTATTVANLKSIMVNYLDIAVADQAKIEELTSQNSELVTKIKALEPVVYESQAPITIEIEAPLMSWNAPKHLQLETEINDLISEKIQLEKFMDIENKKLTLIRIDQIEARVVEIGEIIAIKNTESYTAYQATVDKYYKAVDDALETQAKDKPEENIKK